MDSKTRVLIDLYTMDRVKGSFGLVFIQWTEYNAHFDCSLFNGQYNAHFDWSLYNGQSITLILIGLYTMDRV